MLPFLCLRFVGRRVKWLVNASRYVFCMHASKELDWVVIAYEVALKDSERMLIASEKDML